MHFSSESHLMLSRGWTKTSHYDQNILRNVGKGWSSCIEKPQESSFFGSCVFKFKVERAGIGRNVVEEHIRVGAAAS